MACTPVVTKITAPPRRSDVLSRPRLLDFLHEHIDRKLILISAGAGYGKTTLLVDFVHDSDLKTCWYSLDPTDRDPQVFMEHLLASLGRMFPGFGRRTRQALLDVAVLTEGVAELIGTLVNEMVEAIPEWFVVVLDDFHHVEDSFGVSALLSTLLTYQPEHCHLFITSRTVPGSLPFISLAARRAVAGLGQEDLRFTPEEIRAFLVQSEGVHLSLKEAEALAVESEGWITGILLTRHAQRGDLAESLSRARRSGQPVYRYLAGEVLEQQEAPLRAFLLQSAVLREMSAPLCEEVLGLASAQEMLEQLEQRNLFTVRLTEVDPPRFRYHSLFREFLQASLRAADPGQFAFLHRRVAEWFIQQGEVDAALEHYLEAGEVAEAARVLDAAARDMLTAGRLTALAEWAGRLPQKVVRSYPRLLFLAATAMSVTGKAEQAIEWLSAAEAVLRTQGELSLVAQALTRRALLASGQGQNEQAISLAQEALALAEGLPEGLEVMAEARRVLSLSLIHLGRFTEAADHLEAALEESRRLGSLRQEVLILAGLSNCLYWQGRLQEAVQTQRAVVEAAQRLGSPGYLAEALNDLGFYLHLTGDYDQALPALEEALRIARDIGHPYIEAYALVSLGELLRDSGDPQAGTEMLEQGRARAQQMGNAFLRAWVEEALALAALQLGTPQRAVEWARNALSLAQQQGSQHQQGRYRATLGLALVEAGEAEAGLGELRGACQWLDSAEAREERTRAWLLLAGGLWRAGRREEALDTLCWVLEAGPDVQRQRLLVTQVPSLAALLEEAVRRTVGGARAAALLEEANQLLQKAQRARQRPRLVAGPSRPRFRFYGFGPGRVERDGTPIPAAVWESAKARHLVFYILCHPLRTRDQIGADLWPDIRPGRLPGTFHNTKYRAQQALTVNPIVHEGGVYHISEEMEYQFDVEEFRRLIRQAQQSPPAKASRYLLRAVDLYTGDFLQDCYDEWCIALREELRQQFLAAVQVLSRWMIERGRLDRALALLERGLSADALREDFYQEMMRAHALKGRPEAALAVYRRCQRVLARELGSEPMPETRALARQIRAGRLVPSDRSASAIVGGD